MSTAIVTTGARIHIGFQNLSLARPRLYGGIGIALDHPQVRIRASTSQNIEVSPPSIEPIVSQSLELLDVPGVTLEILEGIPEHVGLGSGTQRTLAIHTAIAEAYGVDPSVRQHAPTLGRGGRSGVGVGTFERGGFILDCGHPTDAFTSDPPSPGEWSVPPVAVSLEVPRTWRFLLVSPNVNPGRSGQREDESIRAVIEGADPTMADEIATEVTQRLLPGLLEARIATFGSAISAIGRKNGAWYTNVQGGTFRPPAGRIVRALDEERVIEGVGQSSWGPTVYGLIDRTNADRARERVASILDTLEISADVRIVAPSNEGATVDRP